MLSILLNAYEGKDTFYWEVLVSTEDGIEVAFFDCRDAELAHPSGV